MAHKHLNLHLEMARFIACIMVILNHLISHFVFTVEQGDNVITMILYYMSRPSAMIYIMVTGALYLNHNFDNIIDFYVSRIKRIFPPLISFSIIYAIWDLISDHPKSTDFLSALIASSEGHLWYLYFMIWAFIFMPFLAMIWQYFFKYRLLIIIGLFLVNIFIHDNNWNFFIYLFLGAYLLEFKKYKFLYLSCWIMVAALIFLISYIKDVPYEFNYDFAGLTYPATIISAIFCYLALLSLPINKFDIYYFSRQSFGVYLIHPIILSIIISLLLIAGFNYFGTLNILILCGVGYYASFRLCEIYHFKVDPILKKIIFKFKSLYLKITN